MYTTEEIEAGIGPIIQSLGYQGLVEGIEELHTSSQPLTEMSQAAQAVYVLMQLDINPQVFFE